MSDKFNEAYERACRAQRDAHVEAETACVHGQDTDAYPLRESPPQILQRHADMHRQTGLRLRAESLKLMEESFAYLTAAGEFDAARRRIVD